ncbi:unnamed protein product [Schistocephalus solidus]|uniref:Flavodoxin n=1 Tax=Schistocephalus solidus TaxID=70667 RepID=A0A183SDJ7_SCHSO|nr:unnamed protein product [Schistocephalus solidus]
MASPIGPFPALFFMGKAEKTRLQDTINGLDFYGRVNEPTCPRADTDDEIRPLAIRLRAIIEPHATTGDELGDQ